MTQPQPRRDLVALTDPEILAAVVRLSPDHHQVATVAHLLRAAEAAGEFSFPITSLEALQGLMARAAALGIATPRPDLVPPGVFPIRNHEEFVRALLAYIRLEHYFVAPEGKLVEPPVS